jgi:hypothetical protein
MTWAEIFDLVRHVVELLFYVIAGPLLSIFAVKQIRRQRRMDEQLLELQRRLEALARGDDDRSLPDERRRVPQLEAPLDEG